MDDEELAMTAAIKVEVEINEEPGDVNLESEEEEYWDNPDPEQHQALSIQPVLVYNTDGGTTSESPGVPANNKNDQFSNRAIPTQANLPLKPKRGRKKRIDVKAAQEENIPKIITIELPEEKPMFNCSVCGKGFSRKDNLSRHVRGHSGIKRFECPICKFKYSDKGALQYHLRTHSGEKPHQCAICGKCFTSKGDLSRHGMVHSGIRPYECDVCKMAFTQSGHLTQHKRSHTGEKPFECSICKKNFTLRTNLSQHLKLHLGLRPYQCEVCQKSFSQRAHLTRHKALHARDAQGHFMGDKDS